MNFKNGNLCGASPELNDVLGKLDAAKTEVTDAIDSIASEAAAAFGASQNELKALTDKLQSIEIPTLPKLNLQSEIAGLISIPAGSPAFIQSLAKIKTEFGDDLKSSGLGLESLVTKATEAILGGDKICALVPNLEKESGSPEPADQKPIASKQAAVPAVSEASSVANQVVAVETQFAALQSKLTAFATGSSPPTKDTPAFHIATADVFKTISLGGGAPTSVAFQPTSVSKRTNYASASQGDGYAYKKSKISEIFTITSDTYGSNNTPAKKLEIVDGQCQLKLKHKPSGGLVAVWVHTGNNAFKYYLDSSECINLGLVDSDGKPIPSTDANGQFYYKNYSGPHRGLLIYSPRYENPKTNFNTMFAPTFIFTPPFALTEHPGNINSGGTYVSTDPDHFYRGGQESLMAGSGFTVPSTVLSDSKLNNIYKNFAVKIRYEYMEKYDPDYVAAPTVAT